MPAIFIQCAADTHPRDAMLGELRSQLDSDLENLSVETQTTLAGLRNRLLWVGLATFAAIVAGSFVLVRVGLSPLRRLSEAVSRVSERDFRLRLSGNQVPKELIPIVEKLEEALGTLERAFTREKQAAADISHELRTPIAALLATTQVSLKKARSPEEYRASLESCSEIGQQLGVLVERLLTLARLDAGADTLKSKPVNVSELADQCISLVRPLAEAQGLSLRLERNGPVVLQTDPDKLREVVTNLLHNAIQYNKPQGRVELIIDRRNGCLNLEVRDTGVGIPSQAREHLFERFYRVDPSRQSDTIHAGLGLAIVKGYLDLLGGKIEVESVEGQGSTFRVVLPLSKT